MRKLVFAALAAIALLCPHPAVAQQQVTPYSGRGPNSLTFSMVGLNDTATIYLTGSSWATVYWTIATAGSGAITTEVSLDGGTNWIPAAYSKRLDAVSANPSITPWANNGPVAGTFETPLPGNCTAFRIRYQTAGTATAGTLTPGLPYAPGVPVFATLYDVTSAVNTVNDTGIIDASGWTTLLWHENNPAGGSGSVSGVDDSGALITLITTTAANLSGGVGPGTTLNGTASTAVATSQVMVPRRVRLISAQVAALTSTIQLYARR